MRNRLREATVAAVTAIVVGALTLTMARTAGQTTKPQAPEILRRADGKPDFSGIWQANNHANWDLLSHAARPMVAQSGVYKDVPVLAAPVVALGAIGWVPPDVGVVEGDEIPYQGWAAQRKRENFDNWLDRDPEIRCYLPGTPRAMYMPYKFQIIQGTNKIMMMFEFAGAQRTIHLDQVDPYPAEAYMGHSVAKWEGDSLVVDVSSFTAQTWFDRAGNFHSDALHVVERYTPISRDAFRYEATIEDPKVFTRSWKISMPIHRRLEPNVQLMEFRCQEMAEETVLGHLRKQQLVRRWDGRTMRIDVTRKVPPGEGVYERHVDGNP
ncbi:MAG TPA: hypothetical protein VH702_18455 [Vicinamibacterales bacterium]|jgi:hypothetical protein